MTIYHFELVFRLHPDEDPSVYLDALFEAGCDDSSPSTGKVGMIGLTFDREAASAIDAISGAFENVHAAIPHAHLERANPWLMNLTELAYEFGFTKQNLAKYQRGESTLGAFPAPFVAGKVSYWVVAEVAEWLDRGGVITLNQEQGELYQTVWGLNVAVERQRAPAVNGFVELLKSA
jgi:hypothetical protein